MARILVVDDDSSIVQLLTVMLGQEGYSCTGAHTVDQAEALLNEGFDLALLDVRMANGSGIDLLAHIRTQFPKTAVVMVTGMDDPKLANRALELGAFGYVVKPFGQNEMLINVANALHRRRLEHENLALIGQLQSTVEERTGEINKISKSLEEAKGNLRSLKEETALRLARTVELRHEETGKHILRVGHLSELLAKRAGVPDAEAEVIGFASMLHDVGKIAIPDGILLKQGSLTTEEFEVVKSHAATGYELLNGSQADVLQRGAQIALSHHEWWDGSGYPLGMNGEEIPISSRIAALADVSDALTSRRCYRAAFPLGTAVEMMQGERGTHFDPDLLDLFMDSVDEVSDIVQTFD